MKLLTVVSGFFLLAAPVVAQPEEEITYQDALAKCQEFVNDPQLVQIKFKVSCFDENYEWRETDRRKVSQENGGLAGHRLIMKEKWRTPDFSIPVIRDASETECPVLTRFKTSRQAELVLTCEQFVESYADPEALVQACDQSLAEASAQTEPTGEEIDLCASAN